MIEGLKLEELKELGELGELCIVCGTSVEDGHGHTMSAKFLTKMAGKRRSSMATKPFRPGAERVPHVICDGCGEDRELSLFDDSADPNKGLLVHETFYGFCPTCRYDFYLTVNMTAEDEGEGEKG